MSSQIGFWARANSIVEDLPNDLHWLVFFLALLNMYWTMQQVEKHDAVSNTQHLGSEKKGPSRSSHPIPQYRWNLFHLEPHITSRPRKIGAMLAVASMIPLHVVYGASVFWKCERHSIRTQAILDSDAYSSWIHYGVWASKVFILWPTWVAAPVWPVIGTVYQLIYLYQLYGIGRGQGTAELNQTLKIAVSEKATSEERWQI